MYYIRSSVRNDNVLFIQTETTPDPLVVLSDKIKQYRYPKSTCEDFVRKGMWIEITANEATRLGNSNENG